MPAFGYPQYQQYGGGYGGTGYGGAPSWAYGGISGRMAPQRSSIMNGYRKIRELGSGGEGTCDLWQSMNGSYIVVKRLRRNGSINPREVRMTQLANQQLGCHSHIIQLQGFAQDDPNPGYFSILYPYYPSGDLAQWYKTALRGLSALQREGYIWSVARQITDAIKDLHSIGICHLDLKPENVLVDTGHGLSVKVADFGLAQQTHELNSSQIGFGTIFYHPPENQVGPGTDVWAIGGILHYITTGHAPIQNLNKPWPPQGCRSAHPQDIQRWFDPHGMGQHVARSNQWKYTHGRYKQNITRYGFSTNMDSVIGAALTMDPRGRPSAKKLAQIIQQKRTSTYSSGRQQSIFSRYHDYVKQQKQRRNTYH